MSASSAISRRTLWTLLALFAAAVALYYPYSPGGRQAANMRRADAHAATLRPTLAADPRFGRVALESITARGGCLRVGGEVATAADVAALRTIIDTSHPPVAVAFYVSADDATTAPAAR